jgi:hypothetical protein
LSKMGSALLNPDAAQEFAETTESSAPYVKAEHSAVVPKTVEDLRSQVAEHLEAHRRRRGVVQRATGTSDVAAPAETRSSRIAAAVAERYSQTPSYRDVLAAEAERATRQARAEAEVAAMNAQAVAAAQLRLLAAYDEHVEREGEPASAAVARELWPEPAVVAEAEPSAAARRAAKRTNPVAAAVEGREAARVEGVAPGELTVRLYEDAASPIRRGEGRRAAPGAVRGAAAENSIEETKALDEEIAFRHAPVFEEPAGPAVDLPANLIEFPRQLVAARKARPRYAEGPLRDTSDAEQNDGQLRIFEVDAAQISIAPPEEQVESAQWTSIWLDAPAMASARMAEADAGDAVQTRAAIEAASLRRRASAGAINLTIVGVGVAMFAGTAGIVIARGSGIGLSAGMSVSAVASMFSTQAGMDAKTAGIAVAVSWALLLLIYHALFALFGEATPGMRCVRIAFCTFEDQSPAKASVRRRGLARLLSILPMGMGYAWAALDEDRLTWHDRISGMYLRRY